MHAQNVTQLLQMSKKRKVTGSGIFTEHGDQFLLTKRESEGGKPSVFLAQKRKRLECGE